MTPYLSKSDFKVTRECPTKLFYKKNKYPSNKSDNEYLAQLAECGFIIGEMAQLLYPGGILIDTLDQAEAVKQTQEHLKADKVVLFEPAIYHDSKLVRIDVLLKDGGHFDLIEVKSKSIKSSENENNAAFLKKDGSPRSEWRAYLEDAAYQKYVLQEAYLTAEIRTHLLLVDKDKTSNIEGLPRWFKLRNQKGSNINVEFSGDADALRADHYLSTFDISDIVELLLPDVVPAANEFLDSLRPSITKISTQIGLHCKNCEYRIKDAKKNGFNECWGELADVKPHIFDTYKLGTIRDNGSPVANDLIKAKKVSLLDLTQRFFEGKTGKRREIQVSNTRDNTEWVDPELGNILYDLDYPLHFIDFETSRMALTYHAGMSPFELVCFQWSCHSILKSGEPPIHKEWLNTTDHFPNFEFAYTLNDAIGDDGTVLVWSNHERSCINEISEQLIKYHRNKTDKELGLWLDEITAEDSRIVDMLKLCQNYYFHPEMGGSNSIKYVLPAIWRNHPELHQVAHFKKYFAKEGGEILNPYKTLAKFDIMDSPEVIEEGTGAMRAYQEILYGENSTHPDAVNAWSELLKQYCELDTAAMLIIYEGWKLVLASKNLGMGQHLS